MVGSVGRPISFRVLPSLLGPEYKTVASGGASFSLFLNRSVFWEFLGLRKKRTQKRHPF